MNLKRAWRMGYVVISVEKRLQCGPYLGFPILEWWGLCRVPQRRQESYVRIVLGRWNCGPAIVLTFFLVIGMGG